MTEFSPCGHVCAECGGCPDCCAERHDAPSGANTATHEAAIHYLLVCLECGNGDMVMPFASQAARGRWANEHTQGTGHSSWRVIDVDRDTQLEAWFKAETS